jgi:hypothetical protein
MVIVEERALPVFAGTATVTSCDPPPESGVIVIKSFCIIFEIKLFNEIICFLAGISLLIHKYASTIQLSFAQVVLV